MKPSSKSRAQRARESAEIDRTVGSGRCDRLHRRSFEPQLTVRIVFEDVTAAAPRPGRDRVAPLGRQHVPRRELVRGRQIQERCRALWQSVGHEALRVYTDADYLRASRRKRERRARRAGILDCCGRAAMQKETGGEANAFPHARSNYYARRIRDDAAGCGEMGGDGGSQRRQTCFVTALSQSHSAAPRQLLQEQPSPSLERKERRVRAAWSEIMRESSTPGE